jgi:hypothetical protein
MTIKPPEQTGSVLIPGGCNLLAHPLYPRLGLWRRFFMLALPFIALSCAVNFGSGSSTAHYDKHIEGTNRVTEIKVGPSP